jgi:pimeloyl-ACP methyl ester carboxylesterase
MGHMLLQPRSFRRGGHPSILVILRELLPAGNLLFLDLLLFLCLVLCNHYRSLKPMTASPNSRLFRMQIILLTILICALPSHSQTAPLEMRYKLATGDRLVYLEVFDREGKSPDTTFHSQFVLTDELLVVDQAADRSLIGVQRNRQSAELLDYHERGKDTLAEQRLGFQQTLATRPVRFADTNLFSSTGQVLLPPQVLREANSKLLYGINEIMPLPVTPIQVGSEWDLGVFGLHMKLQRFEPVGAESCAVFTDTGTRKDKHLQFTFCPESGHVAKLAFEGQYQELDATIHEKVTLELREVHHQETPSTWISDPQTQLAALTAYVAATSALPDASVLDPILKSASPDAQALALAAYYQRGLTPSPDILQSLLQSKDAEVRRLASHFNQPPSKPATQPCELPAVRHSREKPGTTLRGMTTAGFAGAPYMIHIPLDYRGDRPFPLIVYLSGGGGLAFDAALTAGEAVNHSGYLVLYPHAGGDMWWDRNPTETTLALLLEVLRSYNVDTNRVYLSGFSNGGTGTLELGARWPDRFAAIASLMGAGMDSPSGVHLPLRNLLDVPVLFLHGDQDPRIPSSASVKTYDELRSLKPRVPPELHILKGRAHEVTLASDDGYTLPFFDRFTREPFPQTISARVWDSRFPRQYWIELVGADNAPSEVEAHISSDNLIDITTRNVKKVRLLLRPDLFPSAGPIHIRLNGKDRPGFELIRDCQLFLRTAETYSDPFLAYTDEVVLDVPTSQ